MSSRSVSTTALHQEAASVISASGSRKVVRRRRSAPHAASRSSGGMSWVPSSLMLASRAPVHELPADHACRHGLPLDPIGSLSEELVGGTHLQGLLRRTTLGIRPPPCWGGGRLNRGLRPPAQRPRPFPSRLGYKSERLLAKEEIEGSSPVLRTWATSTSPGPSNLAPGTRRWRRHHHGQDRTRIPAFPQSHVGPGQRTRVRESSR